MKKIQNSNFKRLLGNWKTTGVIKSDQGNLRLTGTDSYELILNRNFILHKADVKIGNDRSETLEIITLENESDQAIMHYYNSEGEEGTMTSTLLNDEFIIEGKELKFTGTINKDNTKISGKWYKLAADGKWSDFMELTLEK